MITDRLKHCCVVSTCLLSDSAIKSADKMCDVFAVGLSKKRDAGFLVHVCVCVCVCHCGYPLRMSTPFDSKLQHLTLLSNMARKFRECIHYHLVNPPCRAWEL